MSELGLSPLTALTPLDGRYSKVSEPLRKYFSEYGLIRYRVRVELEWLKLMAETPQIKEVTALSAEATAVLQKCMDVSVEDALRVKEFEAKTNHDVKAVEYLIKEKLSQNVELAAIKEYVHICCTSEDINNLAYAMMLNEATKNVLFPAMQQVVDVLIGLAKEHAAVPMHALTHGQPATPTTFGKEMANVAHRLRAHLDAAKHVQCKGKFNGAVGNFNAHKVAYPDIDWPELSATLVERLGLTYQPYSTQIECHDYIGELAHSVARFNTTLIGFDRDMWMYISRGLLKLKVVAGEVGSSTMPHKVNPIDFENSEGNAGVGNAMLLHLAEKLPISRMQRDLSDSTVLRCIGVGFGHTLLSLKAVSRALGRSTVDAVAMEKELSPQWALVGEAVQTVMRKVNLEGYEKMKELTRGREVTGEIMQSFLKTLEKDISPEDMARLKALTPQSYLGLAEQLAKEVGEPPAKRAKAWQ